MKVKGITIDLGVNTKPVTDGFIQINKELNATDRTLKDINKGLKLDPKSAELLEQKSRYLSKAIEETNKKLEEENKILAELEKQDGGTGKYQQQIDALKREIVDTTNKQKDYQKQLDEVGQETQDVTQETKSLEDQMFSANVKTELLAAGVKLAAEAFKALVGFVKDAITASAEYADNILTEAKVTGLSTDALQEYYYMAELVDTSVDTISGSMTRLEKNMYSAANGSKSSAKYFEELGVSVTDANGELRDADEVFGEIIDVLGSMENETERDALAMNVFGKSAKDLNPLIEAGSDALDSFRQEAYDMGYVLDTETLESLGGMDDAFQRLDNATTVLKNQIGAALAPVITDISEKFMEWAKSVDWDEVRAKVETFISGVIALVQFLSPILSFLFDTIVSAFTLIWNTLQGLWNFFTEAWDGIVSVVEKAKEAIQPIIDTIKGFFDAVAEKVQYAIDKVSAFFGWLTNARNKVSEFFGSIGGRLGFSSGGFASGGYASGGFAAGGYNLSTNVTIQNYSTPITSDMANAIVDRVNSQLGRLLKA